MNTSDLNEIISKIQKLMALTESDNQHESELAASKAASLLQKYNLDLADVMQKKGQKGVTIIQSSAIAFCNNRAKWELMLASAIDVGYMCKSVMNKYYIFFVGREVDVTVACYIYEQLRKKLLILAKKSYREYSNQFKNNYGFTIASYYGTRYQTKRLDYIYSFLESAANALYHRLYKLNNDFIDTNPNALALAPQVAIQEMIKDHKVHTPKFNRESNYQAALAGYKAGESLPIHQGLTQTDQTHLEEQK